MKRLALKLADRLTLPDEIVTQTIGILAKRRAGKSYTARRLVEQLARGGHQVVIVDPKGDWWGVRAAANGKDPGLPITILGGERGDAPLEKAGGELVAKLVVEERVSALLDLSLFRKGEVAVFMADFLEALYRLKAREQFRTPVMLVIDEADAVAPQKPQHGEERMLGAAEDIVRRGGQRGIGCTMITQRSAVLNKNILTQIQVLVALRTIAPQDLKALDAWVDVHGSEAERKTLMASLPSLPVGDAWVWSPGWPTHDGIFERVHVLPIETFDSGATPRPGEKRAEPKALADVDLEAIRRQMADVVQRAAEADPKALRARIRELEREMADGVKRQVVADPDALARAQRAGSHAAEKAARATIARLVASSNAGRERAARAIDQALGHLKLAADALREPIDVPEIAYNGGAHAARAAMPKEPAAARATSRAPVSFSRPQIRSEKSTRAPGGDASLGKGERIVLTAIAQHEAGVTREQLTVLTGYKRSSRDTYLQRLAAGGLCEQRGETIAVTDAGLDALGPDFEPLPRGEALREHWMARLPEGERKVLEVLVAAYPDEVERAAIDDATGYRRSSRDTYLQRLSARRLVESIGRGAVRASADLF